MVHFFNIKKFLQEEGVPDMEVWLSDVFSGANKVESS